MDRNGQLNKVKKDFKELINERSFKLTIKSLRDKNFIRFINKTYVSYKRVNKDNMLFNTEKEIIKRKGLTWKARFVLSVLYESYSDKIGLFVLSNSVLKDLNIDRNFRVAMKKYVSKNSSFIREAGKYKHNKYELTRYIFYDKLRKK